MAWAAASAFAVHGTTSSGWPAHAFQVQDRSGLPRAVLQVQPTDLPDADRPVASTHAGDVDTTDIQDST